jgi:hypothetical protein
MLRIRGQGSAVKLPKNTITITSNTILIFFVLLCQLILCSDFIYTYDSFNSFFNHIFCSACNIMKYLFCCNHTNFLPPLYHTVLSIILGFHCYKSLSPTSITVHSHTRRKYRSVWHSEIIMTMILVLRLSPRCWCRVFSFGYIPGVWIKWVDVSEPGISSIFLD